MGYDESDGFLFRFSTAVSQVIYGLSYWCFRDYIAADLFCCQLDILLIGIAIFATSFVTTLIATPIVGRLARKLDLLDRPSDAPHKSHLEAIPYGGGPAVFCGFAVVGTLLSTSDFANSLLAASAAILILGLYDDWRNSPPLVRFLIQIGLSCWIATSLPTCKLPFVESMPALQVGITAIFITAVTNAFNFLDNMDGLAAGLGSIVLFVLALFAVEMQLYMLAKLGIGLAAALTGFLVFNFPPAKIFLGDAGGLMVGFVVGVISVAMLHGAAAAPIETDLKPQHLAPLVPLVVPLYDLVSDIVIRLHRRAYPWVGDHNHISHRLVRQGMSRRGAVLAIYLISFLTSAPILLLGFLPPVSGWILVLFAPAIALGIAVLEISRTNSEKPESHHG